MTGFPFDLDAPETIRLGLIVLHVDETIESDFRRIFPGADVALHVTRIPSGAEATPETLGRMEADLPRVTALLPPAAQFAAVGYGCTSGTTMIGTDRVTELVNGACRTGAVCNPLSAARDACRHLGIQRLGLVSPYRPDVAQPVCDALAGRGTNVTRAVHFGEAIEANVARISGNSVVAAAREVARHGDVDGIFLSCTNLRTLEVIGPLERELGLPVFGSNLALAWAMARAAGPHVLPRLDCRLMQAEPA
ncbi:maleate cis-trans isomerase family protein [Mameliella sp.]|uniref:maleate cis-trans isomerase family protein n=1 Tax=Mameliella sp. TaxID=1924940 RepID=UPI003B50ACAB